MTPLMKPKYVEKESGDFFLGDVRFKVALLGDYNSRTTDEEGIVLLKPWSMIEMELRYLGDLNCSRILEFGLWRGGSAAIWSIIMDLEQFVGIDIQPQKFKFPKTLISHPGFRSVKLHWETSQDDREKITSIIHRDFDGPLDLVIDDASHQYLLSKATFEICFPRLRPHGIYLLEDWQWAHRPHWQSPSHPNADKPALTNLVFDLVMLAGSRPDIIGEIHIFPPFILIKRGTAELDDSFRISDTIVLREFDENATANSYLKRL